MYADHLNSNEISILTILCWLNAVPEGGITDDDIGDANVLNDVVADPGHLNTFFQLPNQRRHYKQIRFKMSSLIGLTALCSPLPRWRHRSGWGWIQPWAWPVASAALSLGCLHRYSPDKSPGRPNDKEGIKYRRCFPTWVIRSYGNTDFYHSQRTFWSCNLFLLLHDI
jgi:hypothetical protein